MADPLSLTASVVAVLQLAGTLVTYLNDARHASEDRNRLLLEVSSCRGLLYSLKDLAERAPSDALQDRALNKLGRPNGPLDQFRLALEKIVSKLALKRMRAVPQAMLWPFAKKEIDEMLGLAERLKTLVVLALQQDFVLLSESIQDGLSEVANGVRDLQLRADDKERRVIIAWLSPLNFWSKQADVFGTRLPGTGEWFLQRQEFHAWLDGANQCLWCRGIPGAGKTILASIVVDLLQRSYASEDVGVVFLYCDYKEKKQQTAFNLLSSIAQQLAQQRSRVPDSVISFRQNILAKHTRPSLEDFLSLVRSQIDDFTKTFVVVDALDEYLEEDGTRSVFLEQLMKLQPKINLLITSRHLITLDAELRVDATIEIRADTDDIKRYLTAQLHSNHNLATLVRKHPKLEDRVVSGISASAQGMFLVARLHVEALRYKRTKRDLLTALENLPTGISRIYDEAMQRIKSQQDDYELAIQVLGWITHAIKPLSVPELAHALAFRAGDVDLDDSDLLGEDVFVGVCGGLVTVDPQSNIIRLVHYTTEQYFAPRRSALFPTFHTTIATACIGYLSLHAFSRKPFMDAAELDATLAEYPFLLYSAQNWSKHVLREKNENITEKVVALLEDAITMFNVIQVTQHGKDPRVSRALRSLKDLNALQLATYFNLDDAVRTLLHASGNVNWDQLWGAKWTPLHTSATQKNLDISLLFIEYGMSASATTQTGWTVLHAAAFSGHAGIVRFLLDKDVNVNAKDVIGLTPAHLTAFNGNEDCLRLLLAKNVEVDAQDKDGFTALHYASINDRRESVEVLVENGACLGMQTNDSWTSLHWAAWRGNTRALASLLKSGADLEAMTQEGMRPLHIAAASGHSLAVQLLLDHGADPTAQDRTGWTPLHWASISREKGPVEILAARVPMTLDKKGFSALHWAAFTGNSSVLAVLLARAGSVRHDGFSGITALHMAATQGHIECVAILLEHGFEINGREDHGWTALHWVLRNEKSHVIEFLVQNGADVEAADHNGLTPLHMVMVNNQDLHEILGMLYFTLADKQNFLADTYGLIVEKYDAATDRMDFVRHFRLVSEEDNREIENTVSGTAKTDAEEETPSQEAPGFLESTSPAAPKKSLRDMVLKELLAAGAKVHPTRGNRQTVLHMAAVCDNPVEARLFMQAGANVNAKDDAGNTPLLLAAKSGSLQVAQTLLAAGADASMCDNAGKSPLEIARERGFTNLADALQSMA